MADILQWEFAESFTAVEAALLMEGKNPSDCGHDGRDGFGNLIVSEVILSRMKSDYDTTWEGYAFEADEPWPVTLPSEMMNILVKNSTTLDGKARFMKWLLEIESANFQAQRFTREDLQLWLNKGQKPSKYQFKNIADVVTALGHARKTKDKPMNVKTIDQLWRLAETLTVQQAAVLAAGLDPNDVCFNSYGPAWLENQDGLPDSIAPVQTAFAAITNAIIAGKLPAKVIHDSRPVTDEDAQTLIDMFEMDDSQVGRTSYPGMEQLAGDDERLMKGFFVKNMPNWEKSFVDRLDLVAWLGRNGQRRGFFFPTDTSAPDYLDPNNSRYAPKLAAAVKAWQAVTDPKGKSPKQALGKWLREHAADFGLTNDDGKPVKLAIVECSTVANWKPRGGAAKTPG